MNNIYSYKRNTPKTFKESPTHLFATAAQQANRVIRKDQKSVGKGFTTQFKTAIQTLIQRANYSRIVDIHANMDHRMHSMNGPVGTRRFLSWHRVYLLKFEAELKLIDSTLFIPYWNWAVDRHVPNWLKDFLPQGTTDLNCKILTVTRFPGTDPDVPSLPTQGDLDDVLSKSTFMQFTIALEGVHNIVHAWTGGTRGKVQGTMNDIMYSPADPIFWLHHAFVDRVWSIWQQYHPGLMPQLTGADRVLDPWSETVDDVMSISNLGYAYK
jgi:tyrosinase